jgi:DNA polymerase-4
MQAFVHLDLDSFFVSCERLFRPELVGKPLLIGGYGDRAVVSSASYEARQFGVRSAMPMREALRRCPQAVVIRGDMDLYSQKSAEVTEIIAERAPLYEKASIDEHYIDLTGMDRFHGNYKWTHELRMRIIKETGLPISFGISVNKTVAKMATREAKPNGELYIQQQGLKEFLLYLPQFVQRQKL